MTGLAPDTNEARLHALRLQGVQQQLISLFNTHEVSYEEKKAAKAHLKAIADDLPRLACWERNVRAELERRHTQAVQRKAGLRGVLRKPCPDCGASPGYNPDTCTACYAAAAQAA